MKLHHLAFSLVIVALLVGKPLFADQPDYRQSEQKLEQVRERIQRVQAELARQRQRQDRATKKLHELDGKVAQAAVRLRGLEQKLADSTARVAELQQQLDAQQEQLQGHRGQLAKQLRTVYRGAGSGYFKVLLNADDPLRLGRMLTYHRYVQAARRQELNAATAELRRLVELEHAVAAESTELETLRDQELAAQRDIVAARQQRAAAVADITKRIAAGDEELAQLQEDAAALEQLLARLREALADVDDGQLERQSFAAAKGGLDWPLNGALLARYGEERGLGKMRWSGLVIAGQAGQRVRAVARGRVVFADWLRGFGLLLIIDHGDGFMTLYGRNEAVFKENGDWVSAGDVIAAVGTGDAKHKPGLYFEVRSRGQPVNPLQWLRDR